MNAATQTTIVPNRCPQTYAQDDKGGEKGLGEGGVSQVPMHHGGGGRDKGAAERDGEGHSRKGGKAQWSGWNEKPGPSQLSG